MAIIVPDKREVDTVYLDPTHKHCYTPENLERLSHGIRGLCCDKDRSGDFKLVFSPGCAKYV